MTTPCACGCAQDAATIEQLRETLRLRSEALDRVAAENEALRSTVARVEALHRPVDVPSIPGTSLVGFTKCSCTPGSLYAECPTVQALAGESDGQ